MQPALSSAVRKAGWRFIPVLLAAYVLSYMDRTCVGFAALTMNKDLALTASQFGFGAGVFFFGYSLLELPSSAALYRVGARVWLSRIMITWGLASAATAFVIGPRSFYVARFLLGAAEAGFFPGMIYFMAVWFPAQKRTLVIGMMLLGVPVSSVIGGPLCGLLLQLNGVFGLAGWKWLFIALSLPCVALGFACFRLLADGPEQVAWLTAEERGALLEALRGETRERPRHGFWSALKDPRVHLLGVIQFGFTLGSYAIGIWLPLIFRTFRLGNLEIGFLSAGPYAIASAGMMIWAWRVGRRGRIILNVAVACALAAGGLAWAVGAHRSLLWSSLAITVALTGVSAARAIFWAAPSRFLAGAGAAGGLALINSIGTLGGFFGPYMMGWLRDATGSFQVGIAALAGVMLLTALLCLSLRLMIRQD